MKPINGFLFLSSRQIKILSKGRDVIVYRNKHKTVIGMKKHNSKSLYYRELASKYLKKAAEIEGGVGVVSNGNQKHQCSSCGAKFLKYRGIQMHKKRMHSGSNWGFYSKKK